MFLWEYVCHEYGAHDESDFRRFFVGSSVSPHTACPLPAAAGGIRLDAYQVWEDIVWGAWCRPPGDTRHVKQRERVPWHGTPWVTWKAVRALRVLICLLRRALCSSGADDVLGKFFPRNFQFFWILLFIRIGCVFGLLWSGIKLPLSYCSTLWCIRDR